MKSEEHHLSSLLQQLGLSQQEAVTYQALLELETVSVRKVARQSGINRGTTYEAIKKLIGHGLVSVRQRGQREYYSAESPEKIYSIIREKRKELLQISQDAQKLVPDLLTRNARPQGRPLVRYYEDDDGIVSILKDVLQTCSEQSQPGYYAYSSKPLRQYLYREFPRFTERRISEGVSVQVIAIGEGGEPTQAAERKWIAEPDGESISSYVIIYGDKVASISISDNFTPYGVVVEDKGAASMQRLLFERLWKSI